MFHPPGFLPPLCSVGVSAIRVSATCFSPTRLSLETLPSRLGEKDLYGLRSTEEKQVALGPAPIQPKPDVLFNGGKKSVLHKEKQRMINYRTS